MRKLNLKNHQNFKKKNFFKYDNVEELFLSKLKLYKNTKFLFFPEENKELTYIEFYNEYSRLKDILISKKIKKNDKISIIFSNGSEFIRLYFAILSLGAIAVPINPDLSANEMRYIIKNSNSKMIVYESNVEKKIKHIKGQNFIEFSKLYKTKILTRDNKRKKINLEDIAVIIYTSGTTGNPKGVIINHLNIIADSYSISKNFKFNKKTRTLCILPLFHNNGQIATFFAPLYAGGSSVITFGKMNIYNFWNYVSKYKITWTSVMASILSILLTIKQKRKNNYLKAILCGGQVLTKEIHKKFEKKFSVPIFEGYGLTETTSFSCINRFPSKRRVLGSIGKELSTNRMEILDPRSMKVKKAFEVGEICIQGLNVACNYYKLPNQNKKSFKKNWFKSGDFGWRDNRRNFYFGGRKDSLIIKGGENIYPSEIENAIYKLNSVSECAVIGIKDELLGENICAFIKLKKNIKIKEKKLLQKLKYYLGNHKLPKKIIIINNEKQLNEIPKGPTKKILYRKLKEYYEKKI